jgi:hypothetical protein
MKYTVSEEGPMVHEKPPGEVLDLDPEDPQTERLLERGQISPVADPDQGKVNKKKEGE